MPDAESTRHRLRFDKLSHVSAPSGRCRITVGLDWRGQGLEGSAEGIETHHGRTRACAEATLKAALEASGERVRLELVGVKAVRAFDGWVVVTRLNGEAEGRTYSLLGSASCEQEEGLGRAAAISVLDASNRLLEKYMGSGSGPAAGAASVASSPSPPQTGPADFP